MTVKQAQWLFIGLLVVFFILAEALGPSNMGLSVDWTGGGRYQFAGGTAPWALAYTLLFIVLYAWFISAAPRALGQPLPGVIQRFIAFWLDFALAMTVLAPIMGLLPAVTEWRRTGVFAWNFVRTTPAPGDKLLVTVELALVFIALLLYYAVPLIIGKPSPGTCALGYQVIPDRGRKLTLWAAVLRPTLGLIAVTTAYLALFVARDRGKGKIWLDKVFRTRAVQLN